MSTWQQHALTNSASSTASQAAAATCIASNGVKSAEKSDELSEINHTSALSGDFGMYTAEGCAPFIDSLVPGKLYNQSEYSDIELIIESECFYAHRIVLAARSDYFRALLYGGLRESRHENRTIEIKECKAAAFKLLLLYIYTGRINLIKEKVTFASMCEPPIAWRVLQEDVLIDLLGLVHQYGFEQLENSLSTYLKSILSLNNVCVIYDTACLYELHGLQQHCAQFIDNYASEIIKTNEFLALSAVSGPLPLALIDHSISSGGVRIDYLAQFVPLSGNRDLPRGEKLA